MNTNINNTIMDKKKSLFILAATAVATLAYNAFKPIKSKVKVVEPFDIDRYLGSWYEIARLDFKWEKGLSQVTATYSKHEDGSIRVNNQGFHKQKNKWNQSVGKAKFIDLPTRAALKVSFFGPFYSGYHVVKIDKDYQYALVFGDTLDYMWILSREKVIPEEIKLDFLKYARNSGYAIEKLVWTLQD
ncbi:lipocalin family protein [Sphingobacterium sp. SG20118]|uniref:lipocalin family protein n=1 Tax=Sphingobacterium sp. SG20118 TaxID=3367156 RepID=UPI0037DFC7E5